MSKIFKITLTPLDEFFFGGEIVFGAEGGQGDRSRSYLVHSRGLPQQTSLLGMLREQLLRQNGLLLKKDSPPKKVVDAINLIGESGFKIKIENKKIVNPDKSALGKFGVVEEISPLFLQDAQGELWQPAPIDDVTGKDGESVEFNVDENNLPYIINFNTKNNLDLCFSNAAQERKELEKFFAEEVKVGVYVTNRNKWREGEEDDKEGFFRQTFKKNIQSNFANNLTDQKRKQKRNPTSFVFYAKMVDGNLAYNLSDALVTLGGERSCFQMNIAPQSISGFEDLFQDINYKNAIKKSSDLRRIVLMSDVYAEQDELKKYCSLIVAHPISFRFFSTELGVTENYFDFKKTNKKGRTQSKKLTLLQRGGVLYVHKNNLSPLQDYLKNKTLFRQIGYNYFKTVKL